MFGPKTQCVVVVGAQWGDEGKGKIVDVLAERADLVVRYQGGANAGHTVDTGEGKSFVLHQIPSGILQGAVCVVGNGVVLDPEQLFAELDALAGRGVRTEHKLHVSDRAHLTLPYHKLLDRAREKHEKIGTTGRGSGRPTRTSTGAAACASGTCAISHAPRSWFARAWRRRIKCWACWPEGAGP